MNSMNLMSVAAAGLAGIYSRRFPAMPAPKSIQRSPGDQRTAWLMSNRGNVAIQEATREQLHFLYGGVIYRVGAALFGLRPAAPAGDRFDENRVGLDHLAFGVDGVADLEDVARSLDELGVAHAGVKDIGLAHILEFRDPDNIALELYAWKPGRPAFDS